MRGRFKHQAPLFHRPKSSKQLQKNLKSLSSVELPSIYTRSVRLRIPEVALSNQSDVRRQMGRVVTFKQDKISCILPEIYQRVPEQLKALPYTSAGFLQKLSLINQIFGACGLSLKEKDILVAEGQRSQAQYIFITNFNYHPQSLCCQQPVIVKTTHKQGIELDPTRTNPPRSALVCLGCHKGILKFVEKQDKMGVGEQYQKKKKLLDFALHIASGRYKKHRLEDEHNDSMDHVRSRVGSIFSRKDKPLQSLH